MPVSRRYASARMAMLRGSLVKTACVSASSVVQMKAQGRRLPEGIDQGRCQVGHQHHVAGFDALQPDRRAVEADAALHDRRRELAGGHGQVVPAPPQVAEFEVDELDVVLFDILQRLVKEFEHLVLLRICGWV